MIHIHSGVLVPSGAERGRARDTGSRNLRPALAAPPFSPSDPTFSIRNRPASANVHWALKLSADERKQCVWKHFVKGTFLTMRLKSHAVVPQRCLPSWGGGVTVLLLAKAPPRVRLWRGHAELAVRNQGRRLHQGLSDMSEKQAQSRAAATPPCHSTHLVPSPAAVPRPQPNDIRGLEPGFP